VSLGKAAWLCGFCWQKIPLERPRVRRVKAGSGARELRQLQQDGKLQRAVREGIGGRTVHANYRRAVGSVLKVRDRESSVSRQFVAASCNQLRVLCERRLEDLIWCVDDRRIHFGGQVLVVALGIAEGGEKHVLGVCKEPRRTPRWSKGFWKIW